MIYFNKLIDICINRQESQKVVDNNFVGTNYLEQLGLPSCFFMLLNVIKCYYIYRISHYYLYGGRICTN